MVDLGTPKPPEMPLKQGKTSKPHYWPRYMDCPPNWAKKCYKTGDKRQKDKWYPFRAPTPPSSGWVGRSGCRAAWSAGSWRLSLGLRGAPPPPTLGVNNLLNNNKVELNWRNFNNSYPQQHQQELLQYISRRFYIPATLTKPTSSTWSDRCSTEVL